MTVRQERLPHSDAWVIAITDRLDQTQIPKLEETLKVLLDDGYYHLVVDLSQTSYINSGGLRCLVSAWRRAKTNQGSLALCGLNSRLQEIFSMVGFDKVFDIHEDCETAQSQAQSKART